MQTCEQADCRMAFTGVIAHHEVAQKPAGDGHFVPTLVVHLEDVGAGHHNVIAHVPYLPGQDAQAAADARRLQRGQQLTVTTPLTDVRLLLPAASLWFDTP